MTPPTTLFALIVEQNGKPSIIGVHCDLDVIARRGEIYRTAQHLGKRPNAWCCRFELTEAEEVKCK